MGELKLNEEQIKLAREFRDTATSLIQKYAYMEEAFEAALSNIIAIRKTSNEESIKEVEEGVRQLKEQVFFLQSRLKQIEDVDIYSTNSGELTFPDTISCLIYLYDGISTVVFSLGRLEGLSSGKISTSSDVRLLKNSYTKLKEILCQ